MCIMTSYNEINGVHSANNADICTEAARREWHFQGVIMTDWATTLIGGADAADCIKAGNDLIMPGAALDRENIVLRTNGYEDATSDYNRFGA